MVEACQVGASVCGGEGMQGGSLSMSGAEAWPSEPNLLMVLLMQKLYSSLYQ